jgi:hypothetical protein
VQRGSVVRDGTCNRCPPATSTAADCKRCGPGVRGAPGRVSVVV